MHKETVSYPSQATGEKTTAQVDVFDNIDEAKKTLGDKGVLEAVNESITEAAQRKLRHGNQLVRGQAKRAEDRAMREFAMSKGFDPKKIKV